MWWLILKELVGEKHYSELANFTVGHSCGVKMFILNVNVKG